jgi:hypothetical protein
MLSWALVVQASEPVDRATVERMLEVMNAKSMVDSMYGEMDKIFANLAQQLNIKEADQPVFRDFMTKVVEEMKIHFSWEKMKEPMIDIYVKHYTQEEIEGMSAFYESEVGQSMVKKMPVVMQDATQLTMQMYTQFMPRIQELAKEMKGDLEASRREQASSQEEPIE